MNDDLGLTTAVRDGIARVTLTRPQKRNAIRLAAWSEIALFIQAAGADPSVEVGVIQSATPGVFSAGADLAEGAALAKGPQAEQERALAAVERVFGHLRLSPVPWLAVVDGDCRGAALALAAACDLRLMTTRTRLDLPAARNGSAPFDRELAALAVAFGTDVVRQLLTRPDPIDVSDPLFGRVASWVVEPNGLAEEQERWIRHLRGLSRATVSAAKQTLAQITDAARASLDPAPFVTDAAELKRRIARRQTPNS